jgi:hypothetical protein
VNPTPKDLMRDCFTECSGCGTPVLKSNDPCWECVKARARTATVNRGRCTCPAKLKRPRNVDVGHRAWVACDRCLGTIRQLPDPPRKWRGFPRNGPGVVPRASSGPVASWR